MPSYWGLGEMSRIWVQFYVEDNAWEGRAGPSGSVDGINNMNTLPLDNVPYANINSIGKQWIRRFCLSLSKETLGLTRSKFATIPIPGESVTLNGEQLASQAREEQANLRDELKEILDSMTYDQLMAGDADLVENVNRIQTKIPLTIFVG